MEQVSTSSLFSLSIEPVTKAHLTEASKWAKFLAIVGMIFLGFIVIAGLVLATTFSSMNQFSTPGYSSPFSVFGPSIAIVYIIFAVIGFFPLLFLLRFANKTKMALAGNDQDALNMAFQNLKAYLRYIGILIIIWLALFVIGMLFTVIGAAAFS
jgi:uncharacterized membrane protein (UPF0182 family)